MELSDIFKALSDDTRLRILKLLERGELCVCDIMAALEDSQPKVSFHLAVLKEAGFLRDRREGKWVHYRLRTEDMFIRLLLLSVSERMKGETVEEDRDRLLGHLQNKQPRSGRADEDAPGCLRCN